MIRRILRSNLFFVFSYLIIWGSILIVSWELGRGWVRTFGEQVGVVLTMLQFATFLLLTHYSLVVIDALDEDSDDDDNDDKGGDDAPTPNNPIDSLLREIQEKSSSKKEVVR